MSLLRSKLAARSSVAALCSLTVACSAPRPAPVVIAARHSAGSESSAPPASSSPPPSTAPVAPSEPSPEERAVDAALDRAVEAFTTHATDRVTAALDEAREAANGNDALLDRIALRDAAIRVEQGDLPGAVTVVQARIDAAAATHAMREFGLHDAMLFLREAQNDPLGAYLEAEAMRSVADMPTVSTEQRTRWRLGYTWQRAHTLAHLTNSPSTRDPWRTRAFATAARDLFGQLAREQNRSLASIDVLEEDFAAAANDGPHAVAVADRLDLESLDPQDLYLTLSAYIAARHDAGIARVRARIDSDHSIDLLTSVYRRLSRQALERYASSASPVSPSPRGRRRNLPRESQSETPPLGL